MPLSLFCKNEKAGLGIVGRYCRRILGKSKVGNPCPTCLSILREKFFLAAGAMS